MIGKIIAAALMLAVLAFAAPASADGYRHGHRGGYGHHHSYKYYRHDGAAVFAGGLLLGALVGQLATPPRVVYATPPQPVLGNCRTIYGTGYVNGRPAEYSGTGCYDANGILYAMPGTERFLRYLD
ncbi:MAG: hypothetical protein OEY16_07395 [Alphaproteobacteria bacterium]|nr:hypothetical protein [Alphaproteobacteria bacterium]